MLVNLKYETKRRVRIFYHIFTPTDAKGEKIGKAKANLKLAAAKQIGGSRRKSSIVARSKVNGQI